MADTFKKLGVPFLINLLLMAFSEIKTIKIIEAIPTKYLLVLSNRTKGVFFKPLINTAIKGIKISRFKPNFKLR